MTEPSAIALGPPRRAPVLAVLAWAALYLLVAGVLQFHFVSVPWDSDTAYHAAVGQLIRENGPLHAFPWTPFSWLADHYADKELLFHLLFVPFTGWGWIAASKVVATLAGAALLLALYLVLRAEGVPLAGLWALAPLVATDVFLFRFSLARPHLLSIALSVAALWAAARGRLAVLALVSALYPWAYIAWPMPLALVAVAEVARRLSGERLRWWPAVVVLVGLALGLLVHPNTVNLLRQTWLVIGGVLIGNAWGGREGFELGREFDPFTVAQWLSWLMGCVAMTAAALALGWRGRRGGSLPLAFALAALAFGLVTVRTARFAEYFVPFSVAALALASRSIPWPSGRAARMAPACLPVGVLAALSLYSGGALVETVRGLGTREDHIPPALAGWLAQRIPPGAQVYTCGWERTGDLLLALPGRKFIVALDPTFLYARDPDLYRLWYRLPREAPANVADMIRSRFGARYVVCAWEDRYRAFLNGIGFAAGVKTLGITEEWSVYDLGDTLSP